MWKKLIEWLRGLVVSKPHYTTLEQFLGANIWFDDIRYLMQGPQYTNPNVPIQRRDVKDVDLVVLHCTADDDHPSLQDVFALAKYCISPECHINPGYGCPTITYHYYIEFVTHDCVVFKCLDWTVKAWHVGEWNRVALGVAMDYDGISTLPAIKWDAAAKTVAWLLHKLELPASAAVFHRELEGTGWTLGPNGEKLYRKMCPGENLDPYEFRTKVAGYLAEL